MDHHQQEEEKMTTGNVTGQEVADLIETTVEAASAFINGDVRRYVELIKHADDYTLMAPFGGEPRRGFDGSDEALDATARYFRGGECVVDLVQSYASGDLVVLVMMERQHGRIGELPDQDLSLRVTLVFRRAATGWQQVHRHADPLVHPVGEARVAALLRGDG
jgi:ketosteroid isomerase-like protein